MTTKIKWRLGKLPTPEELTTMVRADILTKEEAREILISHETEEDRDKQSLQDEILFLRQLVQSLATKQSIVQTIKYLPNEQMPWNAQPWYKPYATWVNAVGTASVGSANTANTMFVSGTSGSLSSLNASGTVTSLGSAVGASSTPSFTAIKTF